MRSANRSRRSVVTAGCLAALSCGALAGCGNSGGSLGGPQPAASNGSQTSGAGGGSSESAKGTEKKNYAPNEVHVDSKNKKWIGPIPYDVFFNEPLTIASNSAKVGRRNGGNSHTGPSRGAAEKKTEPAADAKPAASGDGDWSTIIPVKYVEAETKKIRNRLTDGLQSVGKYNGNYKDIQIDGAVLAALGGIMTEHSESVSWKANAKYIRDLGAQIEQNSQGLGKKSYDATQAAFDKVTAVLDGSKPGDLPNAADKAPFKETADRGGLMKRMQKAADYAKKQITTEAIFKSSAEDIAHEATMLATFSRVISLPGYASSEEDAYKKHAKALIDAALDVEKSVANQDYKLFNDAMNRVTKKCDECHVDYRFGDK